MMDKQIKLMYITNNPKVAEIALQAGVDIIFVDMEYIGKDVRQNGMDSVKNHHTIEDIKTIKKVTDLYDGKNLMARVNSIHNDSENEIKGAINAGADIVMLPMWKTVDEVRAFIRFVGKKARTFLLLETKEAVEIIDDVLELEGIDAVYIGLNDLHLSYGMKFMFQPLAEGIVESLANKIKSKNLEFGFGGIAKLHQGLVPAEKVLGEHIRLDSDMVILSRSFCNTELVMSMDVLGKEFCSGVTELRNEENFLRSASLQYLQQNCIEIKESINQIIREKQN